MNPIDEIRTELRCSVHGPAWHGPALLESLADVEPDEARARPLAPAHSIAELLLGLAQHNAYHGGQIVLLKRAVRSGRLG